MQRNLLLLLLVMVLLTVVSLQLSYDKAVTMEQGVATIRQIPLRIKDWQGEDYPLDPQVYNILETNAILHRAYRNSQGDQVFLSLVYYEKTKVDFHAPEACLGGQGIKTEKSSTTITVASSSSGSIPLLVNQLLQNMENGTTLVYYFYKAGDFIGKDYFSLRLNLAFNKFSKARKSGSLIRISTPLIEKDDGRLSHLILERFLNDLYPYLVQCL